MSGLYLSFSPVTTRINGLMRISAIYLGAGD